MQLTNMVVYLQTTPCNMGKNVSSNVQTQNYLK